MAASTKALIDEFASAPTPLSPPPSPLSPLSSLLPMIPSPPLHTSPTYADAPLSYKATSIQLRVASPLPVPSPPLHVPSLPLLLPSADRKSDILEMDMPFQKRLCLTAPASRFEIRESSTGSTARQTKHTLACRVSYKFIDTMDASIRASNSRVMTAMEEDAGDLVTTAFGHIHALEARDRASTIDTGHQDGPADAGRSSQGVADALVEHEANRNIRNRDDSHDSGSGRRRQVIEQYTARSGMDSKMAKLVIIHNIGISAMVIENKVKTLTITTFHFSAIKVLRATTFRNKTMSSPNRSTSDIEDALSSINILNYTSVSSDYFPASSGSISFNSSENSKDNMISPVFSSFYNNPCLKDVQAFYAKELPISSPDPITPPAILTLSLILPPSLLFNPRYFFIPEELLPPKKRIHSPSSSSTTLFNSSRNQTYKMYLKHHEKQVKDILNYLDELYLHRVEKIEEGRINGNELKTELKEIRIQIVKLQKKQLGQKDKIAFAYYKIYDLEQIIEKIQARHQTNQEDL
ncbi:hypothetical protein Tco_0436704 [Tanacetum coccineum]